MPENAKKNQIIIIIIIISNHYHGGGGVTYLQFFFFSKVIAPAPSTSEPLGDDILTFNQLFGPGVLYIQYILHTGIPSKSEHGIRSLAEHYDDTFGLVRSTNRSMYCMYKYPTLLDLITNIYSFNVMYIHVPGYCYQNCNK